MSVFTRELPLKRRIASHGPHGVLSRRRRGPRPAAGRRAAASSGRSPPCPPSGRTWIPRALPSRCSGRTTSGGFCEPHGPRRVAPVFVGRPLRRGRFGDVYPGVIMAVLPFRTWQACSPTGSQPPITRDTGSLRSRFRHPANPRTAPNGAGCQSLCGVRIPLGHMPTYLPSQ